MFPLLAEYPWFHGTLSRFDPKNRIHMFLILICLCQTFILQKIPPADLFPHSHQFMHSHSLGPVIFINSSMFSDSSIHSVFLLTSLRPSFISMAWWYTSYGLLNLVVDAFSILHFTELYSFLSGSSQLSYLCRSNADASLVPRSSVTDKSII